MDEQFASRQLMGEERHLARRNGRARVVVTGMGAITPIGNSAAETWASMVAGRSGANRMSVVDGSAYECQINCEVKGFEANGFIPRKKARHMPISSQITLVASDEAIADSGLDLQAIDRDRVGVMIGTAGGNAAEETESALRQLRENAGRLSPFQVLRFAVNMPAFHVSHSYGFRGYSSTVCTACAAGTQAIGEAAKVIQRGESEVMIAGGVDYSYGVSTIAGFVAMHAMATSYNDDPTRAMRPFDANREGFIIGMGGAMLVLERLEHAQARGARILAEVLGSSTSNDAYHLIAPDPEGSGAAVAMRRSLADAGIDIGDVDYINAHATSTPLGDAAETRAIKSVFGERAYDIPVSGTKSMTGHMFGATGAVEAVACVMALNEGIIPPTINYETPDPDCDLDYVPNVARKANISIALSNSFGLGGQNACLILGRLNGR
jgi:3-oxoacyl-[acyl-carrier-protein] synthase II